MAIKFVDKDPEDDKPKKAPKPSKTEVRDEAVTPRAPPSVDPPVPGPKKRGRPSSR